MPSAAQRVQAEGIVSIALFMLLAAVIAPEPTPRGVGLRGVSRHHHIPGVDILPPVNVRPAQALPCRPLAPGATPATGRPACDDATGVARVETR